MSTPSEINFPKTPNGGPAFPFNYSWQAKDNTYEIVVHEGMSLRDWFAGQALSDCQPVLGLEPAKDIADYCYTIADAMLERRLK